MTSASETIEARPRRAWRIRPFLMAFVLATLVASLLGSAVVFGVSRQYDGKILPNVRVGGVDLSGLTRDEARTKLGQSFANLSDGTVKLDTPSGNATITFSEIGRGPDVDRMADEALAAGRDGDALAQGVGVLQAVSRGIDLPVRVKVDPNALAEKLRTLSHSTGIAPMDASISKDGDGFLVEKSVDGQGLDEVPIAAAILGLVSSPDAAHELTVAGKFVSLAPQIGDAAAQKAVSAAGQMVADVNVTAGDQKFVLAAATVHSAIGFGLLSDGTYGPVVDSAPLKAAIEKFRAKIDVKAVDPSFLTGKDGKPVGITGGKEGASLNSDSSTQAVIDYLGQRVKGTAAASVALAVDTVEPKMSDDQAKAALKEMTRVSYWTVQFFPGESNCNGKNIRIPAAAINGTVVPAGEVFSFWQAVGPVDLAHGYCDGGVIKDGKSQHTGAIGGGICSASTTLFNAAMLAGFDILERHQHYYYIDRYPAGLDATVYMDGSTTWDLRWRNDTANPVLIIGKSTYNTITFEIWTVPTGRKVSLNGVVKTDIVKAVNTTQYVTTRPPGQQYWAEYATDGYKITRVRTVTDASGAVIHNDTWFSNYAKVNGVLEIGVAPAPPPTPTPLPAEPTAVPPA